MSGALYNLACMTVASTGTGTITLGSAATINGVLYLSFAGAGVPNGATVYYSINDVGASEIGSGTYTTSGTTLTRNPITSTNGNAAINMTSAAIVRITPPTSQFREILTGSRTYYVGANLGACTISIATPALITATGSNMVAGDPVVFQVPPNKALCTITTANPAVVSMTNTFAAGQPVQFSSTGFLPYPIVPGTVYYVIATGLSGSSFEISTSVGGAAVNTTRLATTASSGTGSAIAFTNAGTNGVVAGQIVSFVTNGGSLPTNISASTPYYVAASPAPTSTVFYVSATNGGTNVAYSAAGSNVFIEQVGTNNTPSTMAYNGTYSTTNPSIYHYCSTVGALPTGITEGTTYYVTNNGALTANAFNVSDTAAHALAGTNTVNTSGSVTGSPIYSVYTGNDSNTGLAATRAAAFLTIQQAVTVMIGTLDFGGNTVTVQVANGTYTGSVTFSTAQTGAGSVVFTGNTTTPSNCLISTTSAACFTAGGKSSVNIQGFKLTSASSGDLLLANGANISVSGIMEYGASAGIQIRCAGGGSIMANSAYVISGGATRHYYTPTAGCVLISASNVVTITGVPALSAYFADSDGTATETINGKTFLGSATGTRYNVTLNGVMNTAGGGANYLPGNAAGSTATGGQYA